jgi:large subunit ribosomal protein L4
MELDLVETKNLEKLSKNVFGKQYNESLIHQVVTAYQAGARAGTRAQKTRAQVRGGGKKPWKQKGTGRARAGTIRSPLWVGGGIVFAARPQDHSQKVNKKMYKAAIRSIFSELLRQSRIDIIRAFKIETPKTKELYNRLRELNLDSSLIVMDKFDKNIYLSLRNIPKMGFCLANEIDPVSLIKYERILITEPAIRIIEENLG